MAFLAVADGAAAAAGAAARDLARHAWEHRAEMRGQALSPEDAMRRAMAAPRGPVVLLDVGDNTGGGGHPATTDIFHGEPVEVAGRVRLVSDGRDEEPTPTHGGTRSVDTPGVTAADLSRFRYDRRRRPLYPFELDATH
jgi:microcystin degradation protein MlrC